MSCSHPLTFLAARKRVPEFDEVNHRSLYTFFIALSNPSPGTRGNAFAGFNFFAFIILSKYIFIYSTI